jgi:L-ascorbate metabolism protein UlaG (beta-lactamase superfamily)
MATLIQPVRSGAELVDEIESTQPAPGCVAVWWLGQSGFLIKSRGGRLVIDPYLSESLTRKYAGTGREHVRMTAAPLRGEELPVVQLALASHKHSDHLDPDTIVELTRRSHCPLGLPAPLLDHARGLGIPESSLVGLVAGQVLEAAGFRVRAVPSAHEGLDTDAQGRHLYLGFVVEMDGLRLYHSGDGLVYDGLEGWLGDSPFDAMFLPINGRDPSRGVPGNMSAAEAVDLASRVRPRFVVPHHYDMFTFNTAPVGDFLREARRLPPGVTPRALRCGERWEIGP